MHSSWFRTFSFRTLVLPTAGITLSIGSTDSNQKQRRRSSPAAVKSSRQADTSPLKQWSPSMFATTLVIADQFTEAHAKTTADSRSGRQADEKMEDVPINRSWTGCNPLTACNSTLVAPSSVSDTDENENSRNIGDFLNTSHTSSNSLHHPPSVSANSSSTQLNELVMKESEDPDAPVVILFGWAGCKDRYLSKYSNYYQKEGYAVARFTAPIMKIRSFSSYRKFALEIYEKILENQSDNKPIYFHVFSMNGCSLFTALWDLLDNVPDGAEIKSRVKGLIFDSSPANVLPWQAANAISTAMTSKSSNIAREAYRFVLTGIFSVHRAIIWLQSNFNSQAHENHFAYFRLQRFEDLPKNQLYLYSDVDDICVRESIEEFQQVQRERQVKIWNICWHDSEHCQHYRKYEKEYIQHCLDFVRSTLK
ncbi:hypothetical protein M3Y97_00654800 [Aphelenchoides bicaudatus]|nr:hypothetical protein M3Y97_00654800 [Aphelenchoides bicaudatus]